MLYASIKYISIGLFHLLRIREIHGAIIEPNIVLYNDIICNDSPQDTCSITCDHVLDEKWAIVNYPDVYCGNTSKCIINCISGWCLRESRIHANHTTNLELISHQDGKSCVQDASLFLPNYGNATMRGDSGGVTGDTLKELIVHSGCNTDRIDIHCSDTGGEETKNDCKAMIVHAENANYVQITSDGAHLDSTKVYCPQNSPLSPSCVINAIAASSAKNVVMHAKRGTPQDVMFYTDTERNAYTNSAIVCLDGTINGTILNTTFVGTACYITLSPTAAPTTAQPTLYPIIVPTYFPTINPTFTPTKHPSITPSANPSTNPSANPSMAPSVSTSADPSVNPSKTPSIDSSPTQSPAVPPSQPTIKAVPSTPEPTTQPVNTPASTTNIVDITMTSNTEEKDSDKIRKSRTSFLPKGFPLDITLFILILVTIFAGCFVIGLYFANRKQKKRIAESEMKRSASVECSSRRKATDGFVGEATKVVRAVRQGTEKDKYANIIQAPIAARTINTNIGSQTLGFETGQTTGSLAQADAEYKQKPQHIMRARSEESMDEVQENDDEDIDDSDNESKQSEGEIDETEAGSSTDSDGMYNKNDDHEVQTPGFGAMAPIPLPPNNYNKPQVMASIPPPPNNNYNGPQAIASIPPPPPSNYNEAQRGNIGLADIVLGGISSPQDDLFIGHDVGSF